MTFSTIVKDNLTMVNPIIVNDSLLVGGQPSQADFYYLQSIGLKRVINLRPVNEMIDFDQVVLMEQLALDYHHIAIADASALTIHAVEKLAQVLVLGDETCIFHCASGNRVGASLALKAFWLDGYRAKEAIQLGLDTGMTKLLPNVYKIIHASY